MTVFKPENASAFLLNNISLFNEKNKGFKNFKKEGGKKEKNQREEEKGKMKGRGGGETKVNLKESCKLLGLLMGKKINVKLPATQ